MNDKNTHAGHRSRMRQRFLSSGQDGLFEHELLELILFYARPVVNTNGIAHDLTDQFGSLSKVLSAGEEKLREVKGVGAGGAPTAVRLFPTANSSATAFHSNSRV